MNAYLSDQSTTVPTINKSNFQAPYWLINGHWETVLPALIRNPGKLNYTRERISTPDGDFLDLDFVFRGNRRIAVLAHGLEGHSDKYYMRGMAHKFLSNEWDTLCWNCRSCSEEINLLPKLYHHGATEDLDTVIHHIRSKKYEQVLLIGFSLGGSLVVKYLGENGSDLSDEIIGGIAFSIPCQLGSCAKKLSEPQNKFYLRRFLKKLKHKIKTKARQFPDLFNLDGLESIRSFYEFDTRYTAPLHGFENAGDFYRYASAGNYIEGITVPVLLVNSINDPMFPDDCYPFDKAVNHTHFYLETPAEGGHLGFWRPGQKYSWAEERAVQFVNQIIGIP
ncbi:MAG: alpha/beta hydrolase [Cytophagales bacterium]|nr:alpha/beta hydrolase [Cytophagales bacterium]